MLFKQIPIGIMQNFAYLIGDEVTKLCAIVDPGWDINKLQKIVKEHSLKIDSILVTHTHFDHINGVNELVKAHQVKIYVHELEAEAFQKLKERVVPIKDDDIIKIGNLKVNVLHTPGHSPGSVCFLINKKLITGDTIFISGCGRTDLPGGNTEQLFKSLKRIAEMDEEIEIYPGHNYGNLPFATIRHEKETNPYLIKNMNN